MERLMTTGEIKEQVERENAKKENAKKVELISYMANEVKEIFEGKYYLSDLDPKDYFFNDIKEVTNKMNCSLIKNKTKLYLCIDKEPNEERILDGLSCDYVNSIKYGFFTSIIMIIFSLAFSFWIWTINFWREPFPEEILKNLIYISLMPIICCIFSYIAMRMFQNKGLVGLIYLKYGINETAKQHNSLIFVN